MVPALPLTMSREDAAEAKRITQLVADEPQVLQELLHAARMASASIWAPDALNELTAEALDAALAKFDT